MIGVIFMNKENSPSNLTSQDYSQEKSIDIEQSKLKNSFTEKPLIVSVSAIIRLIFLFIKYLLCSYIIILP